MRSVSRNIKNAIRFVLGSGDAQGDASLVTLTPNGERLTPLESGCSSAKMLWKQLIRLPGLFGLFP
jgi:hypothetical protein